MKKQTISLIILLLLVMLAGICSLSSHSFWMDEGMRIQFSRARIEDGYFRHCWDFMQVGLVHALYLWDSLVGSSEIVLRAFNLPFLMIAAAYMLRILRQLKLPVWWLLLFALHPMMVYYMNDTGPYISITACTCALIWHCFYSPRKYTLCNTAIIFAWLTLGFSLHFIFGFAGVFYLYALVCRAKEEGSGRFLLKELLVVAPFAALILFIAWRYMQHMPHGENQGWGAPGLFNIASSGYCLAGMAGLGLPRNDMRLGSYHLITPTMIALAASLALSLLVLLILNIRRLLTLLKEPCILSSLVLGVVFFVAAFTRNFQFRERHVIFLYPMVFIATVYLMQGAWEQRRKWLCRPWVILTVALLLTSSARLRYVEAYQKDDYKGAINYLQEKGCLDGHMPVLVQGERFVYHYYNLLITPRCPVLAPRVATSINELDTPRLLELTRNLLRRFPQVALIMTEKEPRTLDLYLNAEQHFKQQGYQVEVNPEFNTFKVIILKERFPLHFEF